METYFETNKKNECNGCGTCALKCPVQAITMEEDSEGFLYPVIDKSKCIECGLCRKVCSNVANNIVEKQTTYISYALNEDIKRKSSSGGMFYPIASYVIKNGGVVFGVEMKEDLSVKHSYVETLEDLIRFQGSKYVRSDLGDSYKQAEKFLADNRLVLFTGTPCQCQGLRSFLGKKYDNLITCEIVCHANPSPKVYKYYLKNVENNYGKKIKGIYFRTKENGWNNQTPIVEFKDGSKIEELSYRKAFISELINRPSCHNCKFSTINRYSDFTIGDLWGYKKIDSSMEDDGTGISLFNVNTEKANEILNEIKDKLFLKTINTKIAFSYNHHCNVPMHKNRDKFFDGISNGIIDESNVIEYMNKYTKSSFIKKVAVKVIRLAKKMMKK